MEFNLLKEPWIHVLSLDGQHLQLSLMDCFSQAHTLYDLAGEMASQNIAILRVMLGILYTVFGRHGLDGTEGTPQVPAQARKRWQTLWDQGHFPMALLEEHLLCDETYERFYLFHPSHPFMQVAIPSTATVSVKGRALPIKPLEKPTKNIIGDLSESDNKPSLFSYRTQKESLGYAEAARWLIHLNSFDVSPLGAPPKDSFRAKGFKVPWPNTLGLVWAQGGTLFETLLLNLVLHPVGHDAWEAFIPSWEEAHFDPNFLAQFEASFPEDPCALFTFPYRRLELVREEGRVTGCTLWGGSLVEAESGNQFTETMTLWRLNKEGHHVPKQHDPSRQIWRDFAALVTGAQSYPPGVVAWLSSLQKAGILRKPYIKLGIGGVVLSSKKTSIDDAFFDSLQLNAAILEDLQEGWAQRISAEVALTERLVIQVGYLARNLAKASGGSGEKDPKAAMDKAREEAYFLLDLPFRSWLESLDAQLDVDAACIQWRKQEGAVLKTFGQELVSRSGLKALVGRVEKDKKEDKKGRIYASPALYQQFIRQLNKLLKE